MHLGRPLVQSEAVQGVSFRPSRAPTGHRNDPKGTKLTPQGPQNTGIGIQNRSQNRDSDALSDTHTKVQKKP